MISIWHWHTEPLLVGSIVSILWVYLICVGPMRSRFGDYSFPKREFIFFLSAVISLYIAIGSPIDAMGENFLFSAHMIQHNILMYITPVLFILGLPGWLVDHFFNSSAFVRKSFKFLTYPLFSALLFTVTFSVWHIPFLYEAALRSKPIHILEHLTFMLPAIFIWWNICSPSKVITKIGYGAQMLLMFGLMLGQTPVFAFLTFSSEVLYKTYEYAPRIMDITPLQDQITGGIFMKIAGMIAALSVFGVAFSKWAKANS
jgi:putative membrane protein